MLAEGEGKLVPRSLPWDLFEVQSQKPARSQQ